MCFGFYCSYCFVGVVIVRCVFVACWFMVLGCRLLLVVRYSVFGVCCLFSVLLLVLRSSLSFVVAVCCLFRVVCFLMTVFVVCCLLIVVCLFVDCCHLCGLFVDHCSLHGTSVVCYMLYLLFSCLFSVVCCIMSFVANCLLFGACCMYGICVFVIVDLIVGCLLRFCLLLVARCV